MSFHINPADGLLRQVGACASGGRTPRAFAVSPSGKFLIVANQDGHNLTVLRFDPTTGVLGDNGTPYIIKSPMCVATASLLTSREVS
jgi:6-phosphogluconolactonase